jgi:glycosyltransferase involved in cell wall biosynthesis
LDAYAVNPLYRNSPVRRWLISNLDGVADVIVGETTKAVNQLRSFFDFSNIVFCPNGLDFRPIENTNIIGRKTDLVVVSRFFDKRKGANLYRAVLPQLLDLGVKIHIIGEGATEFSSQHNFFSHPGLTVTESLQHDEVLKAMAETKIFLSLSIYESFIIALIEAYAMGCRIITTPVGVAEDLAKTSESVSLVSFCPEEILSATIDLLKLEYTEVPLDTYHWHETVRRSGLLHCLI